MECGQHPAGRNTLGGLCARRRALATRARKFPRSYSLVRVIYPGTWPVLVPRTVRVFVPMILALPRRLRRMRSITALRRSTSVTRTVDVGDT